MALKLLALLVIIALIGTIIINIAFQIIENAIELWENNPLQLWGICLIIMVILFVSL
jgi:hypothetical protein